MDMDIKDAELPQSFDKANAREEEKSKGKYTADNTDTARAIAQSDLSNVEAVVNAESIAGVVVLCWLLVHRPEWDFTSPTAKTRAFIPAWVVKFWGRFCKDQQPPWQGNEELERLVSAGCAHDSEGEASSVSDYEELDDIDFDKEEDGDGPGEADEGLNTEHE
jgi:hypothetical protein